MAGAERTETTKTPGEQQAPTWVQAAAKWPAGGKDLSSLAVLGTTPAAPTEVKPAVAKSETSHNLTAYIGSAGLAAVGLIAAREHINVTAARTASNLLRDVESGRDIFAESHGGTQAAEHIEYFTHQQLGGRGIFKIGSDLLGKAATAARPYLKSAATGIAATTREIVTTKDLGEMIGEISYKLEGKVNGLAEQAKRRAEEVISKRPILARVREIGEDTGKRLEEIGMQLNIHHPAEERLEGRTVGGTSKPGEWLKSPITGRSYKISVIEKGSFVDTVIDADSPAAKVIKAARERTAALAQKGAAADGSDAYVGSGTVVHPSGIILATKHSHTAGDIWVAVNNDTRYVARAFASHGDMVLLRPTAPIGRSLPFLDLRSGISKAGQGVEIIGSGTPHITGDFDAMPHSLEGLPRIGIGTMVDQQPVNALNETTGIRTYIRRTTLPQIPGTSGESTYDMLGDYTGMVSEGSRDGTTGLIPGNDVRNFVLKNIPRM